MYRKEWYVFDQTRPVPAVIRNYTQSDFAALIDVQRESFPPPFPEELWWNEEQLANHVKLFPAGALCVEVEGQMAGSITGLIVDFDPAHAEHNWEEMTDNGYIRNHDPQGNALYIVDICVRPSYRKLGLGKWLMQSMYEVVIRYHLERLIGGARMPGYGQRASQLSAEQYLAEVMMGSIQDPVITFLLRCGRTPLRVIANYLEDEQSRNHAVLMEWRNPFLSKVK